MLNDNGEHISERSGKARKGDGWYSFDHKGVHFIGLVNVLNLKAGGLGMLGPRSARMAGARPLRSLKSSTPIVVFAHIPLWAVYPEWGWGTDDSEQALVVPEAIRLGHGAERPYSPDDAEGRRQRDVPHGLSTAFPQPQPGTGRPRADEGAGRKTARLAGHYRCELCSR